MGAVKPQFAPAQDEAIAETLWAGVPPVYGSVTLHEDREGPHVPTLSAMWSYIQKRGAIVAVPPAESDTCTANCSQPVRPLKVPASDRPFNDVPDGSCPWSTVYE